MREKYYTYNNEAIGTCTILAVLERVKVMDIARACLILPFLLDDRIVNYLNTINGSNLIEIVKEKPKLFIAFNNRYVALLPVTINSIILLNQSKAIQISERLYYNAYSLDAHKDLGDRFNNIFEAVPIFLQIMEPHNTIELYKALKIKL